MQLTPIRSGRALDTIHDLLAAETDGHHLVIEQRRNLKGILAQAVDDPA